QEVGAIRGPVLRPVVGRLEHGFKSAEAATAFIEASNVVVTTPSALNASPKEVLSTITGRFTHLFIDEAHHVEANTWPKIRDDFEGKPVVQFTATPFREDGRHLGGRIIYSFPLREAQRQGYFATINYSSVVDFENPDRAIADAAVATLRKDLAAGRDHLI